MQKCDNLSAIRKCLSAIRKNADVPAGFTRTGNMAYQNQKQDLPELGTRLTRTRDEVYQNWKNTLSEFGENSCLIQGKFLHNSKNFLADVYCRLLELLFFYSYLIASIGSSCAAFFAGYQPKKTPENVQTAKLIIMLHGCM